MTILGPFVVLFTVDKKQQTFIESWNNLLKMKPHWCYLSYNETDQWVIKFARITSKALSAEQINIPEESFSNLITRKGNAVPKKLQVMVLSSLHFVEDFESCVLGLEDDGHMHAYRQHRSRENIVHAWSYNLAKNTPLTMTLPPFYERFGIQTNDFKAIDEAFGIKNRCVISEKIKNYRENKVTILDKEMLDSLELVYAYEMPINTASFNKYREHFNKLTTEDVARISRLYFSGKVAYFHLLLESRSNRTEIDLLINKILNQELLDCESLKDVRKKLWIWAEKSPIDVAYIKHKLSINPTKYRSYIDPEIWTDLVAEMPSENVRLICYYSDEALRLFDLHHYLILPLAEKYPEKLQECLAQLTDMEYIYMAQAYTDLFNNPPTVHFAYLQNPTIYLANIFEYMTYDRISQLTREVQSISEENSRWEKLSQYFEEAMQNALDKPTLLLYAYK